jgi:hypothetical protein
LRSALLQKDPQARIDHVYERVHREVHDIHWQTRIDMIERSLGAEMRTAQARHIRLTGMGELLSFAQAEKQPETETQLDEHDELHIAHIARDCRLEIISHGIDIQDCLMRQGDRDMSLRDLLPTKQRNLPLRWDRQHAHIGKQGILVNRTEEVNASTLLPLLHEIGHARQDVETLLRWPHTWVARLQSWEITSQNRRRRECKGLRSVSGWEGQPIWALQRLHAHRSAQEVDAWQFALESLDALTNEGFAIGEVFEHGLVEHHIVTSLWQYRNMYVRDLYIAGGREGLDAMQELYAWRLR